jgi:hypothetical protein
MIGQEGIRASPDQAGTSSVPERTESISTKSRQNRQSTTWNPCSPLQKPFRSALRAEAFSADQSGSITGSQGNQEVICRHMPASNRQVSRLSVSESRFDGRFGPKPSAITKPNPSPVRLDTRQPPAGDADERTNRMIGAPSMHSDWRSLRAEAFNDCRSSCVNGLPLSQPARIDKCQRKAHSHSRSPLFLRVCRRFPTEVDNR